MTEQHPAKRVVIVGGGFAGIQAALALSKKSVPGLSIQLISSKPHFEYYPSLYKVAVGCPPEHACIPLEAVFKGKRVDLAIDSMVSHDPLAKTVAGASGTVYGYDYLVLALGSEPVYFDIPGISSLSYSLKSIHEAERLHQHLSSLLDERMRDMDKKDRDAQVIVVGAGPAGVELAAALAEYVKEESEARKMEPHLVTIDLVENASRVLPLMDERVSEKAFRRLHRLGVNIFLNQAVTKEDAEKVILDDMVLETTTMVWTAGTRPNRFFKESGSFALAHNGRVAITPFMEARGLDSVFVIGDAADTPRSGLAQTAVHDGTYVARVIADREAGRVPHVYKPKPVAYVMPLGKRYGIFVAGSFRLYGRMASFIRRLADVRYLASILPLSFALRVFFRSHPACAECRTEE